tara:strand:+ start:267 stop:788 length:522 start_codon:yes stop_codon:yes gene_type:complete
MESLKENKTIIAMLIMGGILIGLAYVNRDCTAPTEPEEVTSLSQQYGIEEDVALWKAMLEEEKNMELRNSGETHINIDDLDFEEAFKLMRRMKGKNETFHWHGAMYTTLLESEIPKNWVEAGGDVNDNFYCPDNYIDECGVCGGEGIRSWYVDNDGDGIGDPNTLVRTCEKPL